MSIGASKNAWRRTSSVPSSVSCSGVRQRWVRRVSGTSASTVPGAPEGSRTTWMSLSAMRAACSWPAWSQTYSSVSQMPLTTPSPWPQAPLMRARSRWPVAAPGSSPPSAAPLPLFYSSEALRLLRFGTAGPRGLRVPSLGPVFSSSPPRAQQSLLLSFRAARLSPAPVGSAPSASRGRALRPGSGSWGAPTKERIFESPRVQAACAVADQSRARAAGRGSGVSSRCQASTQVALKRRGCPPRSANESGTGWKRTSVSTRVWTL